jgi:NodT family efflux transporter outer membrane factor (OMF) lipoprotein
MRGARLRMPNPKSRVAGFEPAGIPLAASKIAGRRLRRRLTESALILAVFFAAGCVVGPNYKRPSVTVPPAYKEAGGTSTQASTQNLQEKWWEIFGDPQLNALEEQIKISNQNLKASEAQYRQARALVRFYRAEYYPTVTANPSASRTKYSDNKPPLSSLSGVTYNDFLLPGDLSYEVDAWGRIRRTVESARASAEASAADLATVNLSVQSELAEDYFELRSADAQKKLLDSTVSDYEKSLQLTENRHTGGLASDLDVQQARTQLETTRAEDTDVGVARAQFEHAIAVLIGKPPSTFSLEFSPVSGPPPTVPLGLPSQLLERRPDVAATERQMAAANAQIGIAKAAFFPSITLSASGGFESGSLGTLLQGPGLFYSLGAAAAETVFDAGQRRANVQEQQAAYDQTVANYRQTVLSAFQDVEDNLAALRILEEEAKTQDVAVDAARRSVILSTNQYKGGVTDYLTVLTAQSAALADERSAVDILRRRMDASVLLIKALGGGWDVATNIPRADALANTPGGR